jgi:hypothetical protein
MVEIKMLCHTSAPVRELRRAGLLRLALFETTDASQESAPQNIPILEVLDAVQMQRPSQAKKPPNPGD